MPYIKFGITQRESEWKMIEEAMQDRNNSSNRRQQTSGSGYSCYISTELRKALKSINIDAIPENDKKVKKVFELSVSEEDEDKILKLCSRLGVTISGLVSMIIIDNNKKQNKSTQQ